MTGAEFKILIGLNDGLKPIKKNLTKINMIPHIDLKIDYRNLDSESSISKQLSEKDWQQKPVMKHTLEKNKF